MNRPELARTGRTWLFGDNINTDLIFPNSAFRLPVEDQYKLVFSANRPGWVEQVTEGDILIAGTDFGMGSGRPVGFLLKRCGIAGVVVESINGIALRNCVNYGLLAMECKGVTSLFNEGDVAYVDYSTGRVENRTSGEHLQGTPLPNLLADIALSGGIVQMLVAKGLVEPQPTRMAAT
jgi:3-isopropylmalate/(R)-2-methylmalate dehydratase small subunit